MTNADESTSAQKFVVALTGFAFACTAFAASLFLFVPLTGALASSLMLPGWLTISAVLAELFALPVVAALVGVEFAVRNLSEAALANIS